MKLIVSVTVCCVVLSQFQCVVADWGLGGTFPPTQTVLSAVSSGQTSLSAIGINYNLNPSGFVYQNLTDAANAIDQIYRNVTLNLSRIYGNLTLVANNKAAGQNDLWTGLNSTMSATFGFLNNASIVIQTINTSIGQNWASKLNTTLSTLNTTIISANQTFTAFQLSVSNAITAAGSSNPSLTIMSIYLNSTVINNLTSSIISINSAFSSLASSVITVANNLNTFITFMANTKNLITTINTNVNATQSTLLISVNSQVSTISSIFKTTNTSIFSVFTNLNSTLIRPMISDPVMKGNVSNLLANMTLFLSNVTSLVGNGISVVEQNLTSIFNTTQAALQANLTSASSLFNSTAVNLTALAVSSGASNASTCFQLASGQFVTLVTNSQAKWATCINNEILNIPLITSSSTAYIPLMTAEAFFLSGSITYCASQYTSAVSSAVKMQIGNCLDQYSAAFPQITSNIVGLQIPIFTNITNLEASLSAQRMQICFNQKLSEMVIGAQGLQTNMMKCLGST